MVCRGAVQGSEAGSLSSVRVTLLRKPTLIFAGQCRSHLSKGRNFWNCVRP